MVFDFLTRVVEEVKKIGMKEGKLIVCLPHLLTRTVAHHFGFVSRRNHSPGYFCWPDAVQYLI